MQLLIKCTAWRLAGGLDDPHAYPLVCAGTHAIFTKPTRSPTGNAWVSMSPSVAAAHTCPCIMCSREPVASCPSPLPGRRRVLFGLRDVVPFLLVLFPDQRLADQLSARSAHRRRARLGVLRHGNGGWHARRRVGASVLLAPPAESSQSAGQPPNQCCILRGRPEVMAHFLV